MDPTWQTLGIILAGVCVVVGGILALRLHAFLALTLGALVVAVLTPHAALENFAVREQSRAVAGADFDAATLSFKGGHKDGIRPGSLFLVIRREADRATYEVIGQVVVEVIQEGGKDPIAEARPSAGWSLTEVRAPDGSFLPGLRVIEPPALQKAQAAANATIGSRVAAGFGKTCGDIGLVIALAALIGRCLMDSGAADRIVRTALRWTGESGAPAAFMLSGFLLGVPVFFDTVFYLMIPLGKALRVRTGRNYLVYVLTIVCGATMAHSLVPPTPGPLFAAEQLDVGLATMMLGGSIVGLVTAGTGYVFATFAGRIWDLPLRETGDVSLAQLAAAAEVDESLLPPLWLALQPIVLPVGLIAADAIVDEFFGGSPQWLATIGDKNIALALGAAIAIYTLIRIKRQSLNELADPLQAALSSGGIIILITAAGGAFGGVLKETGVAGLIQTLPKSSPAILCAIAFLVTMAIRTAQGSATVAMMTAVGVLGGIAKGGELGFHPVYLALAIGCGSKPIAWMNDSGFWVITRMSGMTEGEGLKYITPMTALMGVVGLVVVMIGVTVWPMG
jgi:GntP family gluconate:H+ symporter